MATIIIEPHQQYISERKQKEHLADPSAKTSKKAVKLFNFAPLFTLFAGTPYLGVATLAFIVISCGLAYFETPYEAFQREIKDYIESEINWYNS